MFIFGALISHVPRKEALSPWAWLRGLGPQKMRLLPPLLYSLWFCRVGNKRDLDRPLCWEPVHGGTGHRCLVPCSLGTGPRKSAARLHLGWWRGCRRGTICWFVFSGGGIWKIPLWDLVGTVILLT
jgi:hypothetical protein